MGNANLERHIAEPLQASGTNESSRLLFVTAVQDETQEPDPNRIEIKTTTRT